MSQYVDNLIKSHKVAVFSKTYCPYCVKAKNVLSKYKLNDLKVIELDDRDDSDQIQEYLKKLTGARTVNYFVRNFQFFILLIIIINRFLEFSLRVNVLAGVMIPLNWKMKIN